MRNFLTKMLDALTSAYSRKDHDNQLRLLPLETNIGKLFSVFAWGLDSVQEQAELIRLWDDLEYARGSVLDRYGANFGVKRISSDDRFYRLAIKVKMMSQLSGGDIDTLIHAAAALLGVEETQVCFQELFPAKIRIQAQSDALDQEHRELFAVILRFFKRLAAAGVGIEMGFRHQIQTEVLAGSYTAVGHCYKVDALLPWHGKDFSVSPNAGYAAIQTRRYRIEVR